MSSPNWWGYFKSFFDGTQTGGGEIIPVGDVPDNYDFTASPDSRELLRTTKGNLHVDLGLMYYKKVGGNMVPFSGFVSILTRVWRDGTTTVEFIDGRTNEAILPVPLSGSDINLQVYNKHPGDFVLPDRFRAETDLTKVEDYLKSQLVPQQPQTPDENTKDLKNFNITPPQELKDKWNIQAWDGNTRITNYRIVFQEQVDGSYNIHFVNNDNGNWLWSNVGTIDLKLSRNSDGTWKISKELLDRADGSPFEVLVNGYEKKEPEPVPEPPAERGFTVKYNSSDNPSIILIDETTGERYEGEFNIEFEPQNNDNTIWNLKYYLDDGTNLSPDVGPTVLYGEDPDSQFRSWRPEQPEPDPPTPGPEGDKKLGEISSEQFEGLIWELPDGTRYNGNVRGFFKGDVDNDGKNEMYFLGDEGQYLMVDKADGYEGTLPNIDTLPTRARRLPQTQIIEYEDTKDFSDSQIWFDSGFNINKKKEPKDILDALDIRGFMLYKKSEVKQFNFNPVGKDLLGQLHIVGIVPHNLKPAHKKKIQPITIEEGEPLQEQTGTATISGGEPAPERFELFEAPQLCGGTRGNGRRLRACEPEEPEPEYKEFKHDVSNSELINFERNILPKEKERQFAMDPLYVQMRETTDEGELISMYGTFSSASYIPEDKRPESLFGLDLDEEHSTHNMAVYIGRENKNGVISIRGTKPGNITDLLSDALILTGYEEQLSIRFEESLRRVKAIMDAHPETKFTLSSHSLGGTINEFIINELDQTPYGERVKAISFNPGKAPNVKTKKAEQLTDFVNKASVIKALKEEDPRFLPIMSSLQRDLGITAEQLTNPQIMTNEQELQNIVNNYPRLTESFNQLLNRLGGINTIEERTAVAQRWITENEELLGTVNYTASLGNLIKTKILFDLAIKLFDFSANYTLDQFISRESELDKKMNKAVKPYYILWENSDNVIFKFKNDPISLHHSFLEDDKQNVRTYDPNDESIFKVGLEGKLAQGLKQHSIKNFIKEKHKGLVDHSETWSEYFENLLNDNVESFSEVINGVRTKLSQKEKEFIGEQGWANFLGLNFT